MDCVNCRILAPGLCTYHIMDLSGCDLGDAYRMQYCLERRRHCAHCDAWVARTEFCKECFVFASPSKLMALLNEQPWWQCGDCGAPRLVSYNFQGARKPGPCARCRRLSVHAPLPLTPEQLAAWVKGGAL